MAKNITTLSVPPATRARLRTIQHVLEDENGNGRRVTLAEVLEVLISAWLHGMRDTDV